MLSRWGRVWLLGMLVFLGWLLLASPAGASARVPGLYHCTQSRTCHYGPINASFPNYRIVCSNADCSFVSAANWEQVVIGVTPSPATVASAYTNAGETNASGLSMTDLWSYWTTEGLNGVYLTNAAQLSRAKASIESAVLADHALFVKDYTARAADIGQTRYGAGTAIMLIDGFTPKGPLVVYQDHTIQMTWAQWNAQVTTVWSVTTSTTPPLTQPSGPAAPSATLTLSSSSVPSTGATVTLTFSSQNATTCSLSSVPSLWTAGSVSVPCAGTYQIDVVASSGAQQWTFTFSATSAEGQTATASQTLSQSAPPPTAQNLSDNWAGYVVDSSSALITDAQGDWTVPTLNCSDTPNSDSAVWIGLGGQQWATGGSSGALLQTGTNSDCVNGVQTNEGWWEVVPATPNYQQTFTSFPVSTGDSIQASVYQSATGAWVTLLVDANTGLSAVMVTGQSWGVYPTGTTNEYDYQGSAALISYSGAYTAEWIVEDPTDTSTNNDFPFANFVSVTFSDLRASFTTWSLTPSETWAIVQDGVTLATPVATATDGFTVGYTGP